MSYWVNLTDKDTGDLVPVPTFQEGGTLVVGGSGSADLNVTYNYCKRFDFKSLGGKTAEVTIPVLTAAVMELGVVRDPDYWAPTPGNAGHACNILLGWAHLHPKAVWEVR